MSVYLLPPSFGDEIQRMIDSFWWGTKTNGRGINWLRWEKLTVRKENGGMGFQDLCGFNLAMMAKQGWNILSNPNTVVAKLLKAKNYPKGDFMEASVGHNSSNAWRRICVSRAVLSEGL